jgi:hypothetical protein
MEVGGSPVGPLATRINCGGHPAVDKGIQALGLGDVAVVSKVRILNRTPRFAAGLSCITAKPA